MRYIHLVPQEDEMNGLLRNQPPVVVMVVLFVMAMGLAYLGEHYLGLNRRSGDFGVGFMTGIGLGTVLNRPKRTRSANGPSVESDHLE